MFSIKFDINSPFLAIITFRPGKIVFILLSETLGTILVCIVATAISVALSSHFRSFDRGHWWERLALNVDQHLKDPVKSMNIIHESLTDSKVRVGHKLALAERANKILASKAVKKSPQLSNLYKEKLAPVIAKLDIQHAPVVSV